MPRPRPWACCIDYNERIETILTTMNSLTVISREQHEKLRWKRFHSYEFAAGDAIAPLVVQELRRACLSLPVSFVKADDGFRLVLVQGLQPGKNLLVGTDGRWLANYIPAAYRSYPFVLGKAEDGRRVLCVRDESGLVDEDEGELFFDDSGEPAQAVKDVLSFLEQVSANSRVTAELCALLAKYELIQPWNVHVKSGRGDVKVEGLYRIDEAALNALPADALAAIRDGGAMPMAYCQLLSMQHLSQLGRLAAHQEAVEAMMQPETGELDLEFLSDDGNIKFS